VAQDAADPSSTPNNASALKLPENPQIFGSAMPSVVKATAIVNGEVITQTDVAQRLMLLAIADGGKLPADQVEALRQQVLRNLIDEVLQIQAAKTAEITVTDKDIDKTVERVAGNVKMTPSQLGDFLKSHGSSVRTLRQQIQGEIAWRRLQQQKIESSVNVGDEEVKAVLERLNASKGAEEYKVGEIFLSSAPDQVPQTMAKAASGFCPDETAAPTSFISCAKARPWLAIHTLCQASMMTATSRMAALNSSWPAPSNKAPS